MSVDNSTSWEHRVLLLEEPRGDRAPVHDAVRSAQLTVEPCQDIPDLCEKALEGAVAVIMAGEGLDPTAVAQLQRAWQNAPPWSELPIIVLKPKKKAGSRPGNSGAVHNLEGVIVLQEPVGAETFTSVLRAARRHRRKQGELRDLLNERQAAADRLAALTEQMESFAHTVSHDLRAPLRAIRGFAQALSEDYSDALDETGREYLHRMEQGAERMDRLIQDLLQYSRLARGPITLAPVDLAAELGQVRLQLEPEIQSSGAALEIVTPLPSVMAHEPTLLQVLSALLSNALKFVPPGVKPQVRIWTSCNGANTRVWIGDNGIGIAPAHHERIFGVFERLHSGETYPGTGMGLAIVAKGMARMAGGFGLESASGEGSRFWIELRRAD